MYGGSCTDLVHAEAEGRTLGTQAQTDQRPEHVLHVAAAALRDIPELAIEV